MFVGDPTHWTARFRSLDARFLECVLAVWPRCVAVLPDKPYEDTITINLVDILSRDARARRLFHHLAYQHEPFGYTADGLAYSMARGHKKCSRQGRPNGSVMAEVQLPQ